MNIIQRMFFTFQFYILIYKYLHDDRYEISFSKIIFFILEDIKFSFDFIIEDINFRRNL